MLVTLTELLEEAERENKAIGSFSTFNMEMTMGIIKAAEELQSSIILQIAEKRLDNSPLDYVGAMMVQAAKQAGVKVAVHLDHGISADTIRKAIGLGFTSVMYDGSRQSFEKNIEETNEICRLAHPAHVSVEAELGAVGGQEATGQVEEIVCTDLEEAVEFAARTEIDALAIAIGNAHGHYHGRPQLDFRRLQEIHEAIPVPLVLHGGSGISPEEFRNCIRLGIRKINIATANMDALVDSAKEYFSAGSPYSYFDLNECMVKGTYHTVKNCIEIFNNKSNPQGTWQCMP